MHPGVKVPSVWRQYRWNSEKKRMERSNQPPKPEGCLAEGRLEALRGRQKERPSRSVLTGTREPQVGDASGLSNTASKSSTAGGEGVMLSASETELPDKVRARRACRGLRAWRAPKETHGTKEARRVPAALTTRAKQERRRNPKKCRPTNRASDWLIAARRRTQVPKRVKEPTAWRSSHRQPVPYE